MTDTTIEVPNNKENAEKWILGNLNFMGYYRVNYDKQNWLKIIHQLKTDHTVFTSTERAALIFDAFTLARYKLVLILNLSTKQHLKMRFLFVFVKSWFCGLCHCVGFVHISEKRIRVCALEVIFQVDHLFGQYAFLKLVLWPISGII